MVYTQERRRYFQRVALQNGLSRRRPRVQVPSTPPEIEEPLKAHGFEGPFFFDSYERTRYKLSRYRTRGKEGSVEKIEVFSPILR